MEWTCTFCSCSNAKSANYCSMCGGRNPNQKIQSRRRIKWQDLQHGVSGNKEQKDISNHSVSSCPFEGLTYTSSGCGTTDWSLPKTRMSGSEVQNNTGNFAVGSYRTSLGGSATGVTIPNSCSNETRIVLIGRTGSGKSATGNTILGRDHFHSRAGGCSVTRKCKQMNVERLGRKLQVVDSPGLFDTGMTNAQTIKEVVKCIGMTSPGPHAIILVTRIDRITQEEQDTIQQFKEIFGEDMTRYLFVLFTRKDDLDADGSNIHSFVKHVPQMLKDILHECNMRYIAFNNRLPLRVRDTQVHELLSMIETNIRANGGRHYTNEMYRQAEEAMVRREAALREELEEKKRREREQIERDYEAKIRKMTSKQKEEMFKLKSRLVQLEAEPEKGNHHNMKSEIAELGKKISDMQKQAEVEREVKRREMEARLKLLEKENREAKRKAREKARKEVEDEDETSLGEIWKGIKLVGKGIWKGFKTISAFIKI